MLHHVSLEVQPVDRGRFAQLLGLLGFVATEAPVALRADSRWFERGGTQVHLILEADPTVPPRGHAAFVVDPYPETLATLAAHGFELREARPHWGERRAFVSAPGGHRLELMATSPASSTDPRGPQTAGADRPSGRRSSS